MMSASLLTDNEKACASNTRRDYVLIKRNLNNLMLILKYDKRELLVHNRK